MSLLKEDYYRITDLEEKYPDLTTSHIRRIIRKFNVVTYKLGQTLLIPEDQLEIFELQSRIQELKPNKKGTK